MTAPTPPPTSPHGSRTTSPTTGLTQRPSAPEPPTGPAGSRTAALHRPDSRRRDDRGSITIWLATSSFVMIIVAGLAVDLGGQVHAQQQARDVAAQAARAGAEEVDAGPAIAGSSPVLDAHQAAQAAQTYLATASMTGTVHVHDGNQLVVRTRDTYTTVFLSLIGIDTLHVTGSGTAQLIRTQAGVAR